MEGTEMKEKNPLSSSELGTLWLTYQEKTLILRLLEHFLDKANDQEAKNIIGLLWQELHHFIRKVQAIFKEEQVVFPVGFTKEDVNLEAPKLFDNSFDIMFVRILKEISFGMYTLNMNMAYREDVMSVYEGLTSISQRVYSLCTDYLIKRGILTLPPNVPKPKTTEFIKGTSYINGLNPFAEDRPLNDIEIGILHHGIEVNNIIMQLFTGFAQVAENNDIKNYFVRGKKITQKQIKAFEEILLNNGVQLSATTGSTLTTSTVAPFSEKLMMFLTFLINGFRLVCSSYGTMFSLRSDISMNQSLVAREIYKFGNDGIKVMIRHQMFEEPPQLEDRDKLISKNH